MGLILREETTIREQAAVLRLMVVPIFLRVLKNIHVPVFQTGNALGDLAINNCMAAKGPILDALCENVQQDLSTDEQVMALLSSDPFLLKIAASGIGDAVQECLAQLSSDPSAAIKKLMADITQKLGSESVTDAKKIISATIRKLSQSLLIDRHCSTWCPTTLSIQMKGARALVESCVIPAVEKRVEEYLAKQSDTTAPAPNGSPATKTSTVQNSSLQSDSPVFTLVSEDLNRLKHAIGTLLPERPGDENSLYSLYRGVLLNNIQWTCAKIETALGEQIKSLKGFSYAVSIDTTACSHCFDIYLLAVSAEYQIQQNLKNVDLTKKPSESSKKQKEKQGPRRVRTKRNGNSPPQDSKKINTALVTTTSVVPLPREPSGIFAEGLQVFFRSTLDSFKSNITAARTLTNPGSYRQYISTICGMTAHTYKLVALSKKYKKQIKVLQSAQEEITQAKNDIASKKKPLIKSIEEHTQYLLDIKNTIKGTKQQKDDIEQKREKINRKLYKVTEKIKSESENNNNNNFFKSFFSKKSPAPLVVDKNTVSPKKTEREKKQEDLQSLIDLFDTAILEYDEKIRKEEGKLEQADDQIQVLTAQLADADSQENTLNTDLEKLSGNSENTKKIESLEEQIRACDSLTDEVEKVVIQINTAEEKIHADQEIKKIHIAQNQHSYLHNLIKFINTFATLMAEAVSKKNITETDKEALILCLRDIYNKANEIKRALDEKITNEEKIEEIRKNITILKEKKEQHILASVLNLGDETKNISEKIEALETELKSAVTEQENLNEAAQAEETLDNIINHAENYKAGIQSGKIEKYIKIQDIFIKHQEKLEEYVKEKNTYLKNLAGDSNNSYFMRFCYGFLALCVNQDKIRRKQKAASEIQGNLDAALQWLNQKLLFIPVEAPLAGQENNQGNSVALLKTALDKLQFLEKDLNKVEELTTVHNNIENDLRRFEQSFFCPTSQYRTILNDLKSDLSCSLLHTAETGNLQESEPRDNGLIPGK